MSQAKGAKTKLIGIGNRYRQDDGVGPFIIEQLAGCNLPDTQIMQLSGEGASLMDAWAASGSVLIFDAVRAKDTPGTIHKIDVLKETVPSDFFHYSTHAFSLAEAVEMARVLGCLPPRMFIFGVTGARFGSGLELSAPVRAAALSVVESVRSMFHQQGASHA